MPHGPSYRASLRLYVRRGKARSPSGRQTHPATFAPAGSNRSSRGGDETAEAFDEKGHVVTPRARRLQRAVNAEQALKMLMWKSTCLRDREGCYRRGRERDAHPTIPPGY